MEASIEWEKYKKLPIPKLEELIGKWDIKMDGRRKIFFKNIKVISKLFIGTNPFSKEPKFKIIGHNIAFWFFRWGKFDVTKHGILHYRNRKVVDWLVKFNKDYMKGLYIKNGKPRCTFTMRRI